MRRLVVIAAVLLGVGFLLSGALSAASDPPGIKWVTAKHVSSTDGAVLYDAYCAVCHGPNARGNGRAARHLSVPVPDLATIAERNGDFNALHVQHLILDRHDHVIMPDWQSILKANFGGEQGWVQVCSCNLAKHLQKLQVQAASR
ncbi:MAG: cytochrome c [Vicinamibacterales bacterium]|jgi:hypothetical protein|nr:cytochrome c [Vicinamibacterales bacterium]